jgi:hypothetical protein
VRGRDGRDLVFRADQRDLDIGRRLQRARGDLRPDATGVAEGDGDAGPPPRRPSQILIST